jgi:hypothetical protein
MSDIFLLKELGIKTEVFNPNPSQETDSVLDLHIAQLEQYAV